MTGVLKKCMESKNPAEFDVIEKAAHYNQSPAKCAACGHRIECIDVIEHYPFNIASVFKYLWRCDLKDAPIQDLKKAMWYLKRALANKEKAERETQTTDHGCNSGT